MAREYWVNFSIQPCDMEENESGHGFGSRVSVDNPELFDFRIEQWAEMIRDDLMRAHAKERKRDQETAAPFWKRWLGGA